MSGCDSNNVTIQKGLAGDQGDAARYCVLTSYSVALNASLAGVVSGYTTAVTTFRFYIGNVETNLAAASVTASGSAGVTYTKIDEVGGSGVTLTITAVPDAGDNFYVDLSYLYQGVTYLARYSICKARNAS